MNWKGCGNKLSWPNLRLAQYTEIFLEVLRKTTKNLKSTVFLDITQCSPLSVNRRFGGTCRFHFQGRKNNKLSKKPA
jgi:hypothetical protein